MPATSGARPSRSHSSGVKSLRSVMGREAIRRAPSRRARPSPRPSGRVADAEQEVLLLGLRRDVADVLLDLVRGSRIRIASA